LVQARTPLKQAVVLWNTEVGWANVHPVITEFGWEYVQTLTWEKVFHTSLATSMAQPSGVFQLCQRLTDDSAALVYRVNAQRDD
jgi:hypothetical protein